MANAQVDVDFLENDRGGHYLLHAGFKFSIRTSRNSYAFKEHFIFYVVKFLI
jgi:hypothetical protein